jgi:hypothetical protein
MTSEKGETPARVKGTWLRFLIASLNEDEENRQGEEIGQDSRARLARLTRLIGKEADGLVAAPACRPLRQWRRADMEAATSALQASAEGA